jgi:serine/threonine protein phosphatase PrpC
VKKPERFLEDAFEQAHEAIQRYAREHGMPDNPRTTIVACLVQHNCAVWAHCGDSRLYWLRRGQILARTRDHSHIEHLIAKGLADPSERNSHPDRNKLYSCLGASTAPKVELSRQSSLEPGDVLLLCSDGLWGILPDTEIVHQLSTHTIVQAVPDMIGMATAIGGPRGDNTTALAIQWQGAHDAARRGRRQHDLDPDAAGRRGHHPPGRAARRRAGDRRRLRRRGHRKSHRRDPRRDREIIPATQITRNP